MHIYVFLYMYEYKYIFIAQLRIILDYIEVYVRVEPPITISQHISPFTDNHLKM